MKDWLQLALAWIRVSGLLDRLSQLVTNRIA